MPGATTPAKDCRSAGTNGGRDAEAKRRHAETLRENARRNREWEATHQPMMTEAEYRDRVLPGLQRVTSRTIMAAM